MPAKKDTRLKHTDDLADVEDPKYMNLAQFTKTTGIGSEGIAEANTIMYTPEKAKTDVQTTTSTPIQPQDMAIIADANTYEIRAKRILQSGVIEGLSPATVIDVTPPGANRERDICSQMSFDMWTDILKEDLQYTGLDTINYDFGYITSEITGDRKFRAAIIDARRRRLPYAEFEVVSEVKDCKPKCLLNSSVHLNNSLLVSRQSVPLKRTVEPSQTGNIENTFVLDVQGRSSNQPSKRQKTGRQEQKTTCSDVSGKELLDKRGIHHETSDEQASEEQASMDISMSLNRDIAEPSMSGTSLALEQDEKQSGISSNPLSTITPTDHAKITTINEAPEEDSATNTAEPRTTTNPTDHEMITTIYEAPEEAPTTNTAESRTAATPTDHPTRAMFNERPEEASTTNTAESQTAATPTTNTTIATMNKAPDEAHSTSYPKLQPTAIPVRSSPAQSTHELELVFHEGTIEDLKNIKDIETTRTSTAEEYV